MCPCPHGTAWVPKSVIGAARYFFPALPAIPPRRTVAPARKARHSMADALLRRRQRRGSRTHEGRYDASVVRRGASCRERCTTTGVVTAFVAAICLFVISGHSTIDCQKLSSKGVLSRAALILISARGACSWLPCATPTRVLMILGTLLRELTAATYDCAVRTDDGQKAAIHAGPKS